MESLPKYQATINVADRNNSHSLAIDFVQAIRPTGLKILEVGCATGYLGSYLRGLGHHVTGVELDPTSAQLAKKQLDEVYCGPIERFYEDYIEKKFDVICFGDVLEHLQNPRDVLERSVQQLNPNGHIICSVPNIAHGATRGGLFEGNWDYADLGILDRTHVHFFTKKTFIELLQSASLEIEKLQATKASIEQVSKQYGISLSSKTISILRKKIRSDSTLEDFQYIASARFSRAPLPLLKPELMSRTPLRILALCDNPDLPNTKASIIQPLTHYADAACRDLRVKSHGHADLSDLRWCDVIAVQQVVFGKNSRFITLAKVMGKPIIQEFVTQPISNKFIHDERFDEAKESEVRARWEKAFEATAHKIEIGPFHDNFLQINLKKMKAAIRDANKKRKMQRKKNTDRPV